MLRSIPSSAELSDRSTDFDKNIDDPIKLGAKPETYILELSKLENCNQQESTESTANDAEEYKNKT